MTCSDVIPIKTSQKTVWIIIFNLTGNNRLKTQIVKHKWYRIGSWQLLSVAWNFLWGIFTFSSKLRAYVVNNNSTRRKLSQWFRTNTQGTHETKCLMWSHTIFGLPHRNDVRHRSLSHNLRQNSDPRRFDWIANDCIWALLFYHISRRQNNNSFNEQLKTCASIRKQKLRWPIGQRMPYQ